MLRFSLYPDSTPISIAVRASRRNLVQISILAPLGLAGGLVRGISALSELVDVLKGETRKAELARQTKDRRSMWSRRLRAIRRAYYRLRESGTPHRVAVQRLAADYRWKDLGWTLADFNHHVPPATAWQEALSDAPGEMAATTVCQAPEGIRGLL